MSLLERLQRRVRDLDRTISVNMAGRPYQQCAADDRELMEECLVALTSRINHAKPGE